LSIAAIYGVSVATISESNGITNVHLIHPGQELVFPSVSGLLYTVAEGDNISEIADKYDIDLGAIWFANALESIDLELGQQIVLPGAKLPDPPPMRVASRSVSTAAVNLSGVTVPGFVWPVQGRITSPFGMRGSFFHGGLDVSSGTGTPIKSAASGKVIFSGWKSSYGYMVEIQHNNDVATLYAHASKLLVKVGETVEQGQVIARVGTTGYTTGPHLHFEVKVRGSQVNPRQFLP
jgi:murein DD-endopeptidase MepM/ murein hydrolase activator NlpD